MVINTTSRIMCHWLAKKVKTKFLWQYFGWCGLLDSVTKTNLSLHGESEQRHSFSLKLTSFNVTFSVNFTPELRTEVTHSCCNRLQVPNRCECHKATTVTDRYVCQCYRFLVWKVFSCELNPELTVRLLSCMDRRFTEDQLRTNCSSNCLKWSVTGKEFRCIFT